MLTARAPRAYTKHAARKGASERRPTARRALALLILMAALSALLRVVLVQFVHAPTVFNDELTYMKLAHSIGANGRLAVLGNEGLSYSPLYPALLSPIHALGASAPAAYMLAKIANSLLISLAIFPLYGIARFVLTRRDSLIVVGLSTVAPLMSFPAFTMSESLAYPLCLAALWALLAAIQRPSAGRDGLLLLAVATATAARVQLIVLVPAALTAILLAEAVRSKAGRIRRLGRALEAHRLFVGAVGAGVAVAGVGALAGRDVSSAFGGYAVVWRRGLPDPGKVIELALHHLAGLELAVGVIPFVGTLVVGLAFVRARPEQHSAFAAVAASFTAWLVLEAAIHAALFEGAGGDVPRIHERFLIYAIPLFFVGFVASLRAPQSSRIIVAAVALAVALPPLIPFKRYVGSVNAVDTFALLPFGRRDGQSFVAVPYASVAALLVSVILALIYVRLGSRSLRSAAAVLVALSALVWVHVEAVSGLAREVLPEHADWVDRASPTGEVVLLGVGGDGTVPALQTTYLNHSIARVYALCWPVFGADAGERRVAVDDAGFVRDSSGPVTASYAVVPAGLGVAGRVLASNPQGGQVLLSLAGGSLRITPAAGVPQC